MIKKSKDYNSFCLDEEDINPLQNFVAQIKSADSDSVIYVSTYGYEITNSKGEKSTYADALWIDTVLPISQIERYIEKVVLLNQVIFLLLEIVMNVETIKYGL